MTLSTSGHVLRGLAFVGVAVAGYVFGITTDRVAAQPPAQGLPGTPTAPPVQLPTAKPAEPKKEVDRRIVGYIYGDIPITREELGEFLITHGGYKKLELLVNKKIIEIEAQKRGVTVTTVEIKAKLEEILRPFGFSLKDFEEKVLGHRGLSLYEYVDDVIRPELLVTKMCRDRVKVTEQDIQRGFENRYGERRQARIICWAKENHNIALKQWAEVRKGEAEFRAIARMQADANLAAAEGLTKPVGRHVEGATDEALAKMLFSLKKGEISGLVEVEKVGIMCVMCVEVIPPDENTKLDEKMKSALTNELFQKKLEHEIPKYCYELRQAAKPNLILKGPPSAEEFREGVRNIVNQAGGVPPTSPAPAPMPMRP